MTCPCCGKEMEFGYLHSGGAPVIWSSKEFKLLFPASGKNEELLVRYGDISSEAYICKTCRILKY